MIEKKLYRIRKKIAWLIPVISCCFLTGIGFDPSETDSPDAENDKTAAAKEQLVARWSFDAPNAGRNSVSDNFHARIGRKVGIVPEITGNAVDFSSKNNKDTSCLRT
jgi:hypothetical protein